MRESAARENFGPFRFSLWTCFVVMGIVCWALALLVHYGPMPGLIFVAIVSLAGWGFLRKQRGRVIGFLGLYAACWIGLQFFGPYTSVRNRIVWIVGTERLQQWAVETMDNPPPADKFGSIALDPSTLPENIRSIAGNDHNLVLLSKDGTRDQILFSYERWFHRWTIVIERPGCTTNHPKYFDEIAKGIRGFNWHRPKPYSQIW